ncbi:glucosaminidase domain-containing protein [Treponema sp.]
MSRGKVDAKSLAAFLLSVNQNLEVAYANSLARYYVEESDLEGVSHDIAFVQMCLETGFLRFGGLVTADMNNFCGLGSIGPEKRGEIFETPQLGVRAHIQHLKGYATDEPLRGTLVDPRYRYIRYGSAPTISDLAGRWASDKEYGNKLGALLKRLYDFAYPFS